MFEIHGYQIFETIYQGLNLNVILWQKINK